MPVIAKALRGVRDKTEGTRLGVTVKMLFSAVILLGLLRPALGGFSFFTLVRKGLENDELFGLNPLIYGGGGA